MTRRTPALVATATAAVLLTSACGGGVAGDAPLDPDTLTVYSSQHENLTKAWVDAFTAETGIEVQVRYGKDASMGNQIVTEGDRSPADVFLTENSPAMTLVQNAGLFAPLDAATLAQVPKGFRPTNGRWTGAAARATALVYNPSLLPESQLPKSLMDLAEPAWKGRWGAGAAGADFQAIVGAVLATQGEERTTAWLAGLKDNARIYANNIATMKAVNAGEVPAGVIYHYYWYRDRAKTGEGSANTRLHFFRGSDPGAFVSVSGAGVLAASEHAADAQRFVAFVTGPTGQRVLAESDTMEYPVGGGVAAAPALTPLDELEPPSIDPAELNGPTVVRLMTDAGVL
ncbi:MAG: iron ABC transporter substrate-binding protein [Actinomycetales bacterium]|nr:iron ABC transporter substrate-binding protein [Actinomycetales bacterium]